MGKPKAGAGRRAYDEPGTHDQLHIIPEFSSEELRSPVSTRKRFRHTPFEAKTIGRLTRKTCAIGKR